jgi:hypothetical protein
MTAAAKPPGGEFVEDGVTLTHPIACKFNPQTIKVTRFFDDGSKAQLVYNIDFTLTGGETDNGGTLIKTSAGIVGTRLRWRRLTPRVQSIDYATADTFPAETHERGLDTSMLIDQEQDVQIIDVLNRAILFPEGTITNELPGINNMRGKVLYGNIVTGQIEGKDEKLFAPGATGPANNTYYDPVVLKLSSSSQGMAHLALAGYSGEYYFDANAEVAQHQKIGKKALWLAPNPLIAGAWKKSGSVVRAYQDLGLTFRANENAATALQSFFDECGWVQTFQQQNPITLDLGCEYYRVGSSLKIRQQNIRLKSDGSIMDGLGTAGAILLVTSDGSVNPILSFVLDGEITVKNTVGAGIDLRNAPHARLDTVIARGCGSNGIVVRACVSTLVKVLEAYGCGASAYLDTAWVNDRTAIGSNIFISGSIDCRVQRLKAYGCGGGFFAYESQHPVLESSDVEVCTNRGHSLETVLGANMGAASLYTELQLIDNVEEKVTRLLSAAQPFGENIWANIFAGGELIGGTTVPFSYYAINAIKSRILSGRFGGRVDYLSGSIDCEFPSNTNVSQGFNDNGVRTNVRRAAKKQVTLSVGQTSIAVVWDQLEINANYVPNIKVVTVGGAPALGAFNAWPTAITTAGFTLNIGSAPGAGASITYEADLS